MASNSLSQKIKEAANEAKRAPADFSKEHIVVAYTFGGKAGQRILRSEGTDAFGTQIYYDYRTGATKSLEALGRFWGVSGLKETHKADLVNLKVTSTTSNGSAGEGRQPGQGEQHRQSPPGGARSQAPDSTQRQRRAIPPQQPSAPDTTHHNTTPSGPNAPGHAPVQQHAPGQQRNPINTRAPRIPRQPGPAHRQPPLQKPLEGKFTPKASEPKAPFEPPQGRPAGTARTSTLTELSRPMPIFDYFNRYYGGTVHCASVAWGITMSYLCAERGRSAVIFPVSSWKLRDYVTSKKNKEVAALVNPLDIPVRTNKDYYEILANSKGALKPGAVMTLDSGHTYDGKLKNQPTHTMVYIGYDCWADNRNDEEVIFAKYSDVSVRSKDAQEFLSQAAKETKNAISISPADLQAAKNDGAWLQKGKYVLARENGAYVLYDCSSDNMTEFKQLPSLPSNASAAAISKAIKNPWTDVTPADMARIGSLKDGECAIISPQINNRYMFSSLDGGVAKSIQVFGKDVFTGFSSTHPYPVKGLDGKGYMLRREYTAEGNLEIAVYSAPSDVVCYILQKKGGELGISVKTHWFLDRFMWCGGSGVYQVDMGKMPPAKKRAISSSDFQLQSTTAEGFAALLSKTYGVQFEYALNEIIRQNKSIPYPRARVKNISVILAVILPDVKIGRVSGPIELVETPAERKVVRELKGQKPAYTPMDKEEVNIQNAVILRRDAYLKRCGDIDSKYYKMGIMASNVDALKVILYNELFSSPKSLKEEYEQKGFFSDREGKKFKARKNFGINGNALGDVAAKVFAGKENSRIDSWGPFQTNIDYVRKYLEGYHVRKAAGGKAAFLPDAVLGAKRRDELAVLMSAAGASKETLLALRHYEAMPRDKRELVADMLYDFPFALYFANKLFSENKGVVKDQANKTYSDIYSGGARRRVSAGQYYTDTDAEMTSVFAYNRGIIRANIAIFQQNLLLAGQNIAGQAMNSKDTSARAAARELYSKLKGMQVDGLISGRLAGGVMGGIRYTLGGGPLGKASSGRKESATFEVFKAICQIRKIDTFELAGKGYSIKGMGIEEFEGIFGKIGNYKRLVEFFSLPQFSPQDFSTKADPDNEHPYPMLSYKFLKTASEANPHLLTQYLGSYAFYIKPVEEEPRGPTYASATLKLDRYDIVARKESNKINIQYTVPYSPGLGTMRVYNSSGGVAATIFEKARQREGKYFRVSPPLPPGVYAVKYTVGATNVASTIAITHQSPKK